MEPKCSFGDLQVIENVVPGARIELATPAFSGRRSTNELPRQFRDFTILEKGALSSQTAWRGHRANETEPRAILRACGPFTFSTSSNRTRPGVLKE